MLRAANAVSPNEPDILFRMAECLKTLEIQHELEGVLRQLIAVARASGDRRRLWALEELVARYPKDLEILVQLASALGEAGRIDDAVTAWKRVSAHVEVLGIDFVPMLRKAAEIAIERSDVGVDLADILLIARRPRDALSLLVPFYEKFPEDIGVLGALVRALEQLGALDKVIPARIELIKTRVKRGHRELAFQEVARLMELAPEDPLALEVSAHTFAAFGFKGDATKLWRRLAKLHEQHGRIAERDRAIMMMLKMNPDDPEALALGARSLYDAGRIKEADALSRRLSELEGAGEQGSMPSAPPGDWVEDSMPDRATDTEHPAAPFDSETAMVDDDAIEEVFDRDYPSDVFAPDDLTGPEAEPMPIARNPYAQDLDLELPTRIANPASTAELALPEENALEDETTSRMEMEDDLISLREAFLLEEDATKLDLPGEEDPTLPPPDDWDELSAKTRSQLISDLLKETSQNDDL
jgi:Flp pilus assembly protein TadD